jgi:hypothetical protein
MMLSCVRVVIIRVCTIIIIITIRVIVLTVEGTLVGDT